MSLSPHHVHIKELNALGLSGGSDDDKSPRNSEKKSKSPVEKPCSTSEEEKLVQSDEEKSESYGTFGAESKATPKKRVIEKLTRSPKHPVESTNQPTEMEGSGVHGLDVFAHEEKASRLKKLSPPPLTRTRKFPPGTPPKTATLTSSPEISKDCSLTGAIAKRSLKEKSESADKLASELGNKPRIPKSASTSIITDTKIKESGVKPKTVGKGEETSKGSKLKSTYKSPRKAIQKCISYLTSPPKKESKEQETRRPRTRSQTKIVEETEEQIEGGTELAEAEQEKTKLVSQPKSQAKPKTKKKGRERSTSRPARPVDKMALISSVDKSSESDTSPQCSPRKSRRRRDPLIASIFGTPIEKVCKIVSKPDSDSCTEMDVGLPSEESSSTGDKLLSPLAKLSTEALKEESSNIEEQSGSDVSDGN